MYSLSHELRAILLWDLDHEVTALPLRKVIAEETECLLLELALDSSPAQSESVKISTFSCGSLGPSRP
jgi:hypothetical protein